ncbi:MAG: MmgE/PrpD family protein, partial [Deltaproteobacteria bacterium]|nr:MmgE/PrpD family protein [Deltaproteobacteria bacterium]
SDPQVDAQFSIPYTVSAALVRGDVFLEDFELDQIMDEEINALARRVKVVPDPALAEKDILHSTVTIRKKDGRADRAVVKVPLGNPANPLDMDWCRKKFAKCVRFSRIDYDTRKSHDLLFAIDRLEQLSDVGLIAAATEA